MNTPSLASRRNSSAKFESAAELHADNEAPEKASSEAGSAHTIKAQRRQKADNEESTDRIRLLVVEDEEDLREILRFNLERNGFTVTNAASGEEAMETISQTLPDLIVLDLMLPGIDGLEVCRRLRNDARTSNVPIIMLTARGEEADIVTGLELGADDYITKPCSPREVVARVKAIYRRVARLRTDDLEFENEAIELRNITVRPDRHEVRVEGEVVNLTATEFRLLCLLVRRPGRVFTRQQIIEAIHGDMVAVTDRSVDVQVVSLRRKLGQVGQDIQTVRGVGYRFRD